MASRHDAHLPLRRACGRGRRSSVRRGGAIVVGGEVGMASAVKMSTASVYKGTSALLAHALLAADDERRARARPLRPTSRLAGARRRISRDDSRAQPPKSGRFVAEMREIAATRKRPVSRRRCSTRWPTCSPRSRRASSPDPRPRRSRKTLGSMPCSTGCDARGTMVSTADRRARFRELHARDELFVMPNPWDVGSARLLAAEGFEALATTSQGFAWAHRQARSDRDA